MKSYTPSLLKTTIRQIRILVSVMFVTVVLVSCSSGDSAPEKNNQPDPVDDTSSTNWDQLIWDRGAWQ